MIKKKIFSMLIACALTMSLVACGATNETVDTESTKTEVGTTQTPTNTPTETPEVEEVEAEGITIGGELGVADAVEVSNITEGETYEEVITALSENNATATAVFDINLTKDNVKVQPSGAVTVTLTLPAEILNTEGNTYTVYRMEDNGLLTKLNSTVNGNTISFETTHFSVYIVEKTTVAEPTDEPTPTPTPTPTPEPTPEPHVHDYANKVVEATCTANGYVEYTCKCGDTYKTTLTSPGHKYGDYVYNKDASYTKDGTKTATCSVCGDKKTVTAEGTKLSYTYTDASGTKYAKSNVNLRDLPSTDGAKIGSLNKGDAVTVTGVCKETGWYRISYNGGVAYVSNSYLVDTKPEEPKPTPTPEPEKPSGPSDNGGVKIISREESPFPLYQPIETDTTLTYYWINCDTLVDGRALCEQMELDFAKKHNVSTVYCIEYTITYYAVDTTLNMIYKATYSIIPPQ